MVDEPADQPDEKVPVALTAPPESLTPPAPLEYIHLALGPDKSHCIHTTPHNSWSHRGSTASLNAWRALHLSILHCVALTPHGGWVVTGVDQVGEPVVASWESLEGSVAFSEAENWADSRRAWKDLTRTLQNGDRDGLADVRFGVGGRGSWWLRWSDGRLESGNLPKQLQTKISEKELAGITPTTLTLGTRDSYIAFWSDGRIDGALTGYDGVHEVLAADSGIVHVCLSPVRDDEYMHVDKTGFVGWNFRFDEEARQDLFRELLGYMQRRAWADGTSFSMTNTSSNGSKQSIKITPDTDITKSTASISSNSPGSLPALAKDLWADPSRFMHKDVLIPAAIGAGAAGAAGGAVLLGVRQYRLYRMPVQADAAARSGSLFGKAWSTARFARRLPGPVLAIGGAGLVWQLGYWRGRWVG
ncbi:hypothetical protein B0A48_00010 [Cryoendolithus antarcticus]|uniref:Uncharacterized protein n=1 Tax=Cryoendolithus antarcticus TaxID=1507870 RepID=A0A1V8TTH4_9PEZI|nr:hypothetical protein B0A48_00010 [Cryoendolithus antarcticus]